LGAAGFGVRATQAGFGVRATQAGLDRRVGLGVLLGLVVGIGEHARIVRATGRR
jgi:hypothetical protein